MNIFVGNLAGTVTEADLHAAFAGFGTLLNLILLRDTESRQPLGYAHVYLAPDDAGRRAIADLHGAPLHGRGLVVRECVFRSPKNRRGRNQPWSGMERRSGLERRRNGRTPAC